MTTIQDTITYQDGGPANGRVVITCPPFSYNGAPVAASQTIVEVVDGAFSATVYPNMNAQPTGVYYTAAYELEEGPVYQEYWIVPNQPQVNIGQVRASFPLTPSIMINAAQLTSAGAAAGQFLGWNGANWVPMYVSTFNYTPNSTGLLLTENPAPDLAVSGSPATLGGSFTLNVPDAGAASRGVVTTGAQTFAGAKTFASNVTVNGTLGAPAANIAALTVTGSLQVTGSSNLMVNPLTTLGDIVVRGSSAPQRFAVGADGEVLTADSTQPQGVRWLTPTSGVTSVFGRAGIVTARYGDYDVSQVVNAVPNTTQIIAGTGLAGGGALTGDVTLNVAPDTTLQQVRALSNGTLKTTRSGINFIAGANVSILVADDSANNAADVTIASTGGAAMADPTTAVGDLIVRGAALPAATQRLPVGTNGYVLTATPSTAPGVAWVPSGSVGIASPLTTKGDIWVYATADTRLAAGTANQALIVNSAQTAGLQWAAIVNSFHGRTGVVVPANGDYTAAQVTNAVDQTVVYSDPAFIGSLSYSKLTGAPVSGVSSFNTRTGAVMPASGDYTVSQVTGAFADPTTTTGDIIYRSSTGTTRLGVGSSGQVLTVVSGVPGWAAASGGGGYWVAGSGGAIYYNGGNVGIGTANPADALHVASGGIRVTANFAAGAIPAFGLDYSPSTGQGRLVAWGPNTTTAGGFLFIQLASDGSAGGNAYTVPVCITSTGLVGIGTTSPQVQLDVSGCGVFRGLSTPTSGKYARMGYDTAANAADILAYDSTAGAFMPLQIRANPAFFGGGNVGIGTSSPTASVHAARSDGSYQIKIERSGSADPHIYGLAVSGTAGNPALIIDDVTAGVNRLIITPGGNVGIGTTSPTNLLEVNGNIATYVGAGFWLNPARTAGIADQLSGGGSVVFRAGNGDGRMAITAGGLVGIGTSSPRGGLTIISGTPNTAATARQLTIGEGTDNHGYDVALGYGNLPSIGWAGVLQANQNSVSATLLLNPAGGVVGIGTSAPPNYSLHVQGDCNITGAFRVNGTAIGGGITTQTAPGRALNTVYQNSTGKPMFVSVSATPSAGTGLTAKTDGGNPPGTTVALGGVGSYTTQIAFWVLPGNYYEVLASSAALNQWTEWY